MWSGRRGAVSAFVARHQRAWDGVAGGLAVIYFALAARNDDVPGSVPPAALALLCALFVAEFAARCWDAPSRLAYARAHWLDVISCITLVGGLRALRLVRLLRLGATGRLLVAVEHEIKRWRRGRQSLWFVVPLLVLLWVGSAYGIWVLEHGRNHAIASFGDALYWSAVTVTTVGYGNIAPVTPAGRVLAGLLAFVGLGLLGFASARLTAVWLRQEAEEAVEEEAETVSDAVLLRLDLLRAEVAELRRLLQGSDAASNLATQFDKETVR